MWERCPLRADCGSWWLYKVTWSKSACFRSWELLKKRVLRVEPLLHSDKGLVFTSRSWTRLVRSNDLQQEFFIPRRLHLSAVQQAYWATRMLGKHYIKHFRVD